MPRLGRGAPRKPIKRSKTFTGCWTCRSRGVKCGEERPTCARCKKGSFHCEGYGVKLVWPDECGDAPTVVQRRLFSRMQHDGPILSDQSLDLALETLDSAFVIDQEHCSPFSVFRLPWSTIPEERASTESWISPEEGFDQTADDSQPSVSICGDLPPQLQDSNTGHPSITIPIEEDPNEAGPQHNRGSFHQMSEGTGQDDSQHSLNTEGVSDNGTGYVEDEDVEMLQALSHWLPGTLKAPGTANADPWVLLKEDNASQNAADYVTLLLSDSWIENNTVHLDLADFFRPIIPPGTSEERQLMHYWIAYLSSLMISVESPDNPYRTLWVPMALYSSIGKDEFPGHAALLHAIYAISAFNQVQLNNSNFKSYFISATKHYQLGLRYLRKALTEQGGTQLEAVLAAISAMSFIEVINGQSSTWRSHLKGGREWLRSFERTRWNGLGSSKVYQFFLCAEALGSVLPCTTAKTPLSDLDNICDSDYVYDHIFGFTGIFLEADYCLDQYFGITKPILEAIIHINHLSVRPHPPSKTELEGLEIKIRLNRPTTMSYLSVIAASETNIAADYALVFYYACYIHFKHTLLRVPSEHLQKLVRQSVKHLQAIEIHEAASRHCGLLWPTFVIACESDESDLRETVSMWFSKGKRLGIATVTSAANVVLEVWRRRDRAKDSGTDQFVDWRNVMTEMSLDILLL